MANPNIVNVTSMLGETIGAMAGTSLGDLVVNAAASGKVYKVNSLIATNTDNASARDITVNFNNGTSYAVAQNVTIPTNSSLVVITKDSSIYLQEGEKLEIKSDIGSNTVQVVCSYEVIS